MWGSQGEMMRSKWYNSGTNFEKFTQFVTELNDLFSFRL